MDATEGENSADQAGADPGVPESGAPPPGSGTPQPLDADLAAMQTTQPGDADLAAIVRSVDEGQVEGVQLTALVAGMLFFGELASGAQWWKETGELARGAGGDANTQFADGADVVSQIYSRADIAERRPIGYLHMRNVIVDDNRHMGLWRIPIGQVQGWRWGG
jgi:hypothetical protein